MLMASFLFSAGPVTAGISSMMWPGSQSESAKAKVGTRIPIWEFFTVLKNIGQTPA
jgi:hypothetical protein